MRILWFLILLVFSLPVRGQWPDMEYNLELSTMHSNDSILPFWMRANRQGKIPDAKHVQMADLFVRSHDNKIGQKWTWDAGLGLVYTCSDRSDLMLHQAYGKLRRGIFQLRIGTVSDTVRYHGLSATNGNILHSLNARPFPGIELSVPEYVDVPYTKGFFKIKGLYSENLLNDTRYVKNAKVHHKNLYILAGGDWDFNLRVGLNHFVQWGGVSRDTSLGNMNLPIRDYWRILGPVRGVDEENWSDYLNAMGNHIGSYDLAFIYKSNKIRAELYHQNIMEDGSGLRFKNWRDGVTGLYIELEDKPKWLDAFMYEFYYTMHQSGNKHGLIDGIFYKGRDKYFNNGIYRSGWTYFSHVIGLPFFTPAAEEENNYISGVQNNRIIAHHFSFSGEMPAKVQYEVLFAHRRNYGTYDFHYEIVESIGSVYLRVSKYLEKLPLAVSVGFSGDLSGNASRNLFGFCFSASLFSERLVY